MGQDWRKVLEPFFGKRCAFPIGLQKDHTAYVFDAEKEKANASSLFSGVIGDWAHVKEHLGKKPSDEFVLFACQSDDDDDPFSMVIEICFYDRASGEVYYYEDGTYDPVPKPGGGVRRLDELQLKAV
jgi:hypothetical protein